MIISREREHLIEMGYMVGAEWIPYPRDDPHFYDKRWCDIKVDQHGDEEFGPIWPNALHFRTLDGLYRFKESQVTAIRYYGDDPEWNGKVSSLIEPIPGWKPPVEPPLPTVIDILESDQVESGRDV